MNKTAIFFSKLHLFTILTKWRRCNSTRIRMYKCMAFESVQIDCIGNKCLDRFHLVWHNASIRHFFFVFLIYFTNGFLKISDCRFFFCYLYCFRAIILHKRNFFPVKHIKEKMFRNVSTLSSLFYIWTQQLFNEWV